MARNSAAPAAAEPPADTPNPLVAEHATLPAALRLRSVTLIGIVGPTANPSALLRLSGGRILKLDVGDKSPAGTVAAIGGNAVRLSRRGRIKTLRIPPT